MTYLLAAASLPSAVPEAGLDLREFYASNSGYFWTLAAVNIVAVSALGTIRHVSTGGGIGDRPWVIIIVLTLIMVLLARTRRRWVHVVAVGLLGAALMVAVSMDVLVNEPG